MARNCDFLRRVQCLGPPSWGTLTPSTKFLQILVEGHWFYGLVWLLPSCRARLPGHRTPNLEKNIDKFPLAPSKKGVIWTMQYMFVSGHVGCKKTVFAAYKFRCHYKQLSDLEFSTSQSIRVFRIFRGKKLELQIFLTSDKMAFRRACGPLSRCRAAPEQLC